jgi:hypothetical protein
MRAPVVIRGWPARILTGLGYFILRGGYSVGSLPTFRQLAKGVRTRRVSSRLTSSMEMRDENP